MGENGHGVRGVATDLKHARRLEDLAFKGDHFAFIGQAFFFEAEQHPPCGRAARSPVSSKHRGCAPFLHCSTRIALEVRFCAYLRLPPSFHTIVALRAVIIILRSTGRPYCTTIGKGVRRIGKGVRRISVNVRAPRARAHQRRPRHHGLNVFTACDQEFHVVGGGHDALLRHHGAQHRRRCNTGKGFRSTCGRFPSATRSWCVQQRRAWPFMSTVGCCITLVTPPVPYGVPRLAMRPFYNVATRRGAAGRRSI